MVFQPAFCGIGSFCPSKPQVINPCGGAWQRFCRGVAAFPRKTVREGRFCYPPSRAVTNRRAKIAA